MVFVAVHRISRISSVAVLLLLWTASCFWLPSSAAAQATAAISGTVRDSSGAVLPDAGVVLHNTATNLDRTTTTNSVGYYVIPEVQPGAYDVRVSKQGFNSAAQANVQMLVNQPVTIDFALKVGSIS